jgi:UDP-N-acetylglucosamine 4,6-dehydratase/5-epimerase
VEENKTSQPVLFEDALNKLAEDLQQAPSASTSKNSILVTGGTGSFGKAFVKEILKRYPKIKRLVIYSRDELKQYEMSNEFPTIQYPGVRYFIGDVRDLDRLKRAMHGIDTVVHAAALKQVSAAEYNPFEFIKTNVLGSQNIVDAALDCGVKKVIALSTDKAAAPINLYGATKLCSDKLFIAANNYRGQRDVRFSVVRYGNVMGSRGSVIPFFMKMAKTGVLPITDPQMTRFNITLEEGVNLVLSAIESASGGEVIVPKIPSYRITDVAEAIGPSCEKRVIGIRPGEKLHEEMITSSDSYTTVEFDRHFFILPPNDKTRKATLTGGRLVEPGFNYQSDQNGAFLSVEELRQLIKEHIDPKFQPV